MNSTDQPDPISRSSTSSRPAFGSLRSSDPIVFLRTLFADRRRANSSYSLRAFSRHLGISSGLLSEILASKRSLTPAMAERFAERLELFPEQRRQFIGSVSAKALDKQERLSNSLADSLDKRYRLIEDDHFSIIAEWYHFAILNLLDTVDAKSDPKWFARRLGISSVEARQALERLTRLGLIREVAGQLALTTTDLTTSSDVSSAALRLSHKRTMEMTARALEEYPIEMRDITSISMAADPERLPEAKKMIRKFRRELCALLESGNRTEVFTLNIQLHPLTKIRNSELS